MTDTPTREPWEALEALLAASRHEELEPFLETLPPGEIPRTLSRLSDDDRARLLAVLGPETAARVVQVLPDVQVTDIIEELPAAQAAAIVDELPSDQQADLLADLDRDDAQAILDRMEPEGASDARRLLEYPAESAGGLMITEYLAYPRAATAGDVVRDMREHSERYADYDIQYVYVTDDAGRLVGVLRLRDLLLARASAGVEAVMIADPRRISADASLDRLARLFDEFAFVGIPVTDREGRLVGVVPRLAVAQAVGKRATRNFLRMSGLVGADELRTMPVRQRSLRRLTWLSLNIVLNVIAASVIAVYQDTIAAVIALAVFLPIISDMSGCSGNQAVAVSMRELALGLVRPREFVRVIGKELSVGVLNGLMLGILLGGAAALWQGNVFLGLVVGGALMVNTANAVVLGGLIPLALKRLRFDPALASGPILTTITDMLGFFLVLSFATAMLGRLA